MSSGQVHIYFISIYSKLFRKSIERIRNWIFVSFNIPSLPWLLKHLCSLWFHTFCSDQFQQKCCFTFDFFRPMVCTLSLWSLALSCSTVGDGAALLDVGHLPHTGHSIQNVGQSAASLCTATGAIQEAFKYLQIVMLCLLNLSLVFQRAEIWWKKNDVGHQNGGDVVQNLNQKLLLKMS